MCLFHRREELAAVKTFGPGESVTGRNLYRFVKGVFPREVLKKASSFITDTTPVNTGRLNGANTLLRKYLKVRLQRDVHLFECLFHVNELYLKHVITFIDGPSTATDRMAKGSAYNEIHNIGKPSVENMMRPSDIQHLGLTVSPLGKQHIRNKLINCAELRVEMGSSKSSFSTNIILPTVYILFACKFSRLLVCRQKLLAMQQVNFKQFLTTALLKEMKL